MTNILIYGGLGILLLGSVFGFFVAYKGYKETDWGGVKRISARGAFTRGPKTPAMKRLVRLWLAIMILGFVLLGAGISIGLSPA